MTNENCQLPEKVEYSKQQCDNKLQQLEQRIDVDFPFVKNENGSYSIMKDQIVLDIEITSEKIKDANTYILQILTYFKQNNQKYYDNYLELDNDNSNANIDMVQKWRNKTYVKSNDFWEIFWTDSIEDKKELISFLHKILNVHQEKWYTIYDYNDSVDNSENQEIINSVQALKNPTNRKYWSKNIGQILEINSDPNRKQSLANLSFLINKSFKIKWSWISSSNSFMELTYHDMPYTSIREDSFKKHYNLEFTYDGWAFINISQNNITIGHFRLNNYNDQIILSQLLWETSVHDYQIPDTSSSIYKWSRPATTEELKH